MIDTNNGAYWSTEGKHRGFVSAKSDKDQDLAILIKTEDPTITKSEFSYISQYRIDDTFNIIDFTKEGAAFFKLVSCTDTPEEGTQYFQVVTEVSTKDKLEEAFSFKGDPSFGHLWNRITTDYPGIIPVVVTISKW